MAQRKTVTVFFSDVVGSTSLAEALDPEALRGVMERYFDDARAVLEGHGGTIEKFIGDAVVALFGIPIAREDDALRALRAAAEIRQRQAALNDELERAHGVRISVRTGIYTGEVAVDDSVDGFRAAGDTMNTAARLEQAAPAGEILIGALTRELGGDAIEVEPVEPLELKGKAEAAVAYRLVRVLPHASPYARREDSPLVGRSRELELLSAAVDRAVARRRCEIVTLVGPAGAGKTRLARELIGTLGGATRVLAGRCIAYGEGITFLPIVEALSAVVDDDVALGLLEGDEAVAQQVAALVRGELAGSTDETFWAVRRFLEALAVERALLLLVDDIHWAEPTLLDLLEYVASFSTGAPIVLLSTSRPELLEDRPSWSAPRDNATVVVLEPLSDGESTELAELLAGSRLGEGEVRRIIQAAEGNPLFLEQLLDLNAGGAGELVVPATIQALLDARIDQLEAGERLVLEHASIEGREFHRRALFELLPEDVRALAGAHLLTLARKHFIRAAPSSGPDDAFAFAHGLMRDAAYGSIPKRARAELHLALAEYLEGGGEAAGEPVGFHLAEAVRYRRELGRDDDVTRDLARRASERLAAAGRRALSVGDDRAAAKILERARGLLAGDDASGHALRLELARSLAGAGRLEDSRTALREVLSLARASADRAAELRAELELLNLRAQTDPELRMAELEATAERAVPELEQLQDESGLVSASWLLHWARFRRGRYSPALDAAERVVLHAQRAGARREELRGLGAIAMAAKWGPTPVEEGLRLCDELVERADAARLVEGFALRVRGCFLSMTGDFAGARAACLRAAEIYRELGQATSAAGVSMELSRVERQDGQLEEAERVLRAAYAELREIGDRGYLSWVAPQLARVLAEEGSVDEALGLAGACRAEMQTDHAFAQIAVRLAEVSAVSQCDGWAEAEPIALEALELVEATDMLDIHGDVLVALADIEHAAGRSERARPRARDAIAAYERKGDVVSAARVRARPYVL